MVGRREGLSSPFFFLTCDWVPGVQISLSVYKFCLVFPLEILSQNRHTGCVLKAIDWAGLWMLVCSVCVQEAYLCVRIAAESMTILTKPCVKITIPQCTTSEQTNCTSKRVTNSMSSHFSQWAAGGLMTQCFLHSHTLQCECMSMVFVYYVLEIFIPPVCVTIWMCRAAWLLISTEHSLAE